MVAEKRTQVVYEQNYAKHRLVRDSAVAVDLQYDRKRWWETRPFELAVVVTILIGLRSPGLGWNIALRW